jgi:hypothetical protein
MVFRRNRRPAAVALAVVVAVCATAGGCAWLRWRSLGHTHVDLMERLAVDAAEHLAAPDRGLQPGDIERLRYPLQRARDFRDSSQRRFGGAPWIVRFDELLGAYAELVSYLDRARTAQVGRAETERARALADRVVAAAGSARDALAAAD